MKCELEFKINLIRIRAKRLSWELKVKVLFVYALWSAFITSIWSLWFGLMEVGPVSVVVWWGLQLCWSEAHVWFSALDLTCLKLSLDAAALFSKFSMLFSQLNVFFKWRERHLATPLHVVNKVVSKRHAVVEWLPLIFLCFLLAGEVEVKFFIWGCDAEASEFF